MDITPGCKVEHISAPGKLGVAVRREIHGNEEIGTWPVWLVVWDNTFGDFDEQNIALFCSGSYSPEDVLVTVEM